MHTLRISLIVVSILSATCAQAQCDLLSWCPFGCHGCKADPGPDVSVTPVADTGRGVWSPAVFTKVSGGTKRFVDGTKNLLSFKKPAPKRTLGLTGSPIGPKPKEPGFFYKLFHPAPPPPPRTIDEWMSLEQIHP